ncbi:hypothetical protein NC653_025289 [Populus alba x Populus x berolinensis]|uniref:Uncharacterized protein n=1 Tax=Populus alba x Populus x berolinensis TaxID=444605 RepID=A0AAD6Q9R9_9ROSI|nr:hypothetical protein NC653_025289 [Populus alba x Populus x berolinensis]
MHALPNRILQYLTCTKISKEKKSEQGAPAYECYGILWQTKFYSHDP